MRGEKSCRDRANPATQPQPGLTALRAQVDRFGRFTSTPNLHSRRNAPPPVIPKILCSTCALGEGGPEDECTSSDGFGAALRGLLRETGGRPAGDHSSHHRR